MRTVNIFKAQPFTKNGEIDSVTILIDRTLPEVNYKDLDEWKQVAKKEAITLCDALCDSLPQGVVDALLVELLDRKRSLLVIPGWAPAKQEESIVVNTTARSLREQILDGKQEVEERKYGNIMPAVIAGVMERGARLQELESSLRAVYDELALRPRIKGLHLIPFEEWLVKRAIDGDQEADELLALRQPQSGEKAPIPKMVTPEGQIDWKAVAEEWKARAHRLMEAKP